MKIKTTLTKTVEGATENATEAPSPIPTIIKRTAAERRKEAAQFAQDLKQYGRTEALHRKWLRAKRRQYNMIN